MILQRKFSKGFTLIELLVVISIIGLLSSVVLASLNVAKSKSRDARRMADLSQIARALNLYYDKFGNWIEASSGCGSSGGGAGWFNYVYPSSQSIGQCLVNAGFLATEIKDPTGSVSGSTGPIGGNQANVNKIYTYMKYHCDGITSANRKVYVFAKLENRPYTTTATDYLCDNGTASTLDEQYGMNYYVKVN
jgi:prepilin-type N-terminal cleavage/methylation domain-containing protein